MTAATRLSNGSPAFAVGTFLLWSTLLAPSAAAQQPPSVLQVPLLPFADTEQWVSPLVDRILGDKLRSVEGLQLIRGEERKLALQELSRDREIGHEALSAATAASGADFAVVGQFMYGDESFNLDLRVFSAEASEQIASFQKPVPAAEIS